MPDYMFLLESRLSAEQRAVVLRMEELSAALGSNIYLAGGAVRDLISGFPIRDLDFTVEGNPHRIARELEKGGARVVREDERVRHVELIFAGDVDGSISAARDDVYARPGTTPELRWSTVMEDLRRRDFSLNAIAISLNPASRGLLLDPTNGLADLEKREVRALSIHSFTNQPVRLLRALRYCVRLSFKLEQRTGEWFALALERGLHENLPPDHVGDEVWQLAREDKPAAILRAWEVKGLIEAIHSKLARRHPHYEMLNRLMRARDDIMSAGYRARLFAPVTHALLARLTSREASSALNRMSFRAPEVASVLHLEGEAKKMVKLLSGRKTKSPRDAFACLEKIPLDLQAFVLAESSNAKARGKIRNFLHKWKPLRKSLPLVAAELEALGFPRGPKFDKVIEDCFTLQLLGKGRTPEERAKLLRRLAGIKEPPKIKTKDARKKELEPAAKQTRKAGHRPSDAAAQHKPQVATAPSGAPSSMQKHLQKTHEAEQVNQKPGKPGKVARGGAKSNRGISARAATKQSKRK